MTGRAPGAPPVLGILCGMEAEARALGRWRTDARVIVRLSAGRADRARSAVGEMRASGVAGLVSWGLCGGLDPALRPGDLVECPPDQVFAADAVIAGRAAKAAAFARNARIVDLESAAVARSGLPARAIRVVLDEAAFALPPPALAALRDDGRPDLLRIGARLLRRPASLPGMIALARRHAVAFRALGGAAGRIGAFLCDLERPAPRD